ncbi:MAG TPA: hypothetical protein VK348_09105 [Planctomycetota bacterium]|nr:hypothetical protein [Planctomycetota bacterium]
MVNSTPGQLRLIDLSLDIVTAVGSSSAREAVLQDVQGGGHDPKKRGFTLEQAELSLGGAVDPYFNAEAHVVMHIDALSGETVTELEEAFLTSQALPADLQLKAGMFFSEFGRINPVHPHAWDWQDQPIINTRVFGGDGMRGPGARLSWLVPTANYTELMVTVQNANGEQMQSFLASEAVYADRPVGGRAFDQRDVRSFGDMMWLARASSSFDLSDSSSTALGTSIAFGPNATGDGANTVIYGADFVYKWRPPSTERGWPFFRLQGEVIARNFEAAAQVDSSVPLAPVNLPGTTLHDYGGYLQALYGFSLGWDAGLRGDWVNGSGQSYDRGTQTFSRGGDMFRAERFRLSPMIEYHPSEFSRFRLQYNYDNTDALGDPVHSVWLGFEVLIGKHPPHKY